MFDFERSKITARKSLQEYYVNLFGFDVFPGVDDAVADVG
jgi:hypothetical protein